MGIDWGCSIVAFASLGVSIIPFAFIYFGERIRKGSKLQQHLQALREEEQRVWAAEALEGQMGNEVDAEKRVHAGVNSV